MIIQRSALCLLMLKREPIYEHRHKCCLYSPSLHGLILLSITSGVITSSYGRHVITCEPESTTLVARFCVSFLFQHSQTLFLKTDHSLLQRSNVSKTRLCRVDASTSFWSAGKHLPNSQIQHELAAQILRALHSTQVTRHQWANKISILFPHRKRNSCLLRHKRCIQEGSLVPEASKSSSHSTKVIQNSILQRQVIHFYRKVLRESSRKEAAEKDMIRAHARREFERYHIELLPDRWSFQNANVLLYCFPILKLTSRAKLQILWSRQKELPAD